MRVAYLAAGAAGMYCGSCMHDHRLAAALRAAGRDVVLLPLYTPLRTDESAAPSTSAGALYYGGINAYLQQRSWFFRHTPAFVDRLLDARGLLRLAGRFGGSTRPEQLGPLAVSVLQGEGGAQRKELRRLIEGVRGLRPDIVQLSNLLLVGLAGPLKTALGVPVVCGLTGEDVFVDALLEPHRGRVFKLIRRAAGDVDGFIALTDYYARHAARHFGLPAKRVHQIPMGIRGEDFAAVPPRAAAEGSDAVFTIGYLARIAPEKGLGELAQAFISLRRRGRQCRVRVAGWLGGAGRPYLAQVLRALREGGVPEEAWQFVGEVDRGGKIQFLSGLDVLAVPVTWPEPKGFYVLEALAAGVPVVQPAHGSFPELMEATGGGLLHAPGDADALAAELGRLMDQPTLRRELAKQGRAAVQRLFTTERMAAEAWAVYERVRSGAK